VVRICTEQPPYATQSCGEKDCSVRLDATRAGHRGDKEIAYRARIGTGTGTGAAHSCAAIASSRIS
jgi:hypothetical protein